MGQQGYLRNLRSKNKHKNLKHLPLLYLLGKIVLKPSQILRGKIIAVLVALLIALLTALLIASHVVVVVVAQHVPRKAFTCCASTRILHSTGYKQFAQGRKCWPLPCKQKLLSCFKSVKANNLVSMPQARSTRQEFLFARL